MSKKKQLGCLALASSLVAFVSAAHGQDVFQASPTLAPFVEPKAATPPLSLTKSAALEPVAILARAEIGVPAEVEGIAQWNAARQEPTKTGFFRNLPVPHKVTIDHEKAALGLGEDARDMLRKTAAGIVWAARLEVEGAWGLRARLAELTLPTGAELWVYSDKGPAEAFGAELIRPDGDLWTPAVYGGSLTLEIRAPQASLEAGETLSFSLDRIAQIFRLDSKGAPMLDDGVPTKFCTESAACWTSQNPGFDIMKRATSLLEIVTSAGTGICSGTLMNSSDGSFTPYFLTAAHCLDSQNDATSTTFYFDYIPSTCGGPAPPPSLLPRVHGAQLLATRSASDSTFLRLFSQPSGSRGYAGWTTEPPSVGETLRSFSHPGGRTMRYSRTSALGSGGCGLSQSDYLFSDQTLGGVQGGSSGSHVMNENLQVVGQLRGACGLDPSDGCFWNLNNRLDGRLAPFYPLIRPWLNPMNNQSCVENETTLCLNDDRFEVTSTYRTQAGETGSGRVVELTDDTGYFWFFSRNNVEAVLKVLSGCGFNNRFWIFAGGLTDVEVSLTVRDTQTGRIWTGRNALGQVFRTIADTDALPCS